MANSRKKNRRRKTLSTVLIILAILIAGAAVGVKLLRKRVTETYGSKNNSDTEKTTVTVGSISTTISGSGTLSTQETTEVSLPASVAIRSLRVEEDATVEAGEILAYLDQTSILAAMNELQEKLDTLDDEILEATKDTVDTIIKSTVTGRVKAVYCEKGVSVLSTMYEHGALLTISLDGYMAVDIPANSLAVGDAVDVTLSGGRTYASTVNTVREGKATILITDNGPKLGETVTVSDKEGQELGTGELYVHQPLNVTGYAGTVSKINVGENTPVTKNRNLLYLSDTTFTGNYDALLQQREETTKDLNELIAYYKSGVLRSPIAGKIESITDEMEESEDETQVADTWVCAVVCPQEKMIVTASIDESYILSVELGQTASVTISSISTDPFTGEVTSIEKTGTSNSGVTYYAVEVTMDKTAKMLPNMSATVAIRIEGVDNALLLPEDAVTKTRTSAYVYTSVNETSGELEGMTEVKTGMTGGGYIEITEGLKEGDTVYYSTKQANSFGSFMGGFGGNTGGSNRPSGSGGSNRPGGNSGGWPSGSGSNRPGGNGGNWPRG